MVYFEIYDTVTNELVWEFMSGATKSSSSLCIEECYFTKLILSKIFYLVLFSWMNGYLTAKYKAAKFIAK